DRGWRGTRLVGRGVVFALIAMGSFAILTVGLSGPIRSAGWLAIPLASRLATAVAVWLVLASVLGTRWSGARALLEAGDHDPRPADRGGVAGAAAGALRAIVGC